jgi:hypothetical protein
VGVSDAAPFFFTLKTHKNWLACVFFILRDPTNPVGPALSSSKKTEEESGRSLQRFRAED